MFHFYFACRKKKKKKKLLVSEHLQWTHTHWFTHSHSLSCRHSRYSPDSHKAFRINLPEKQGVFNSDITCAHAAVNLTSNLKKPFFVWKKNNKKIPPPFLLILSFHSSAGQPYLFPVMLQQAHSERKKKNLTSENRVTSPHTQHIITFDGLLQWNLFSCVNYTDCAACGKLWRLYGTWESASVGCPPTPPTHSHTLAHTQTFVALCIGSFLKL